MKKNSMITVKNGNGGSVHFSLHHIVTIHAIERQTFCVTTTSEGHHLFTFDSNELMFDELSRVMNFFSDFHAGTEAPHA